MLLVKKQKALIYRDRHGLLKINRRFPFVWLAVRKAHESKLANKDDALYVSSETMWILEDLNMIMEKAFAIEPRLSNYLPYVGIAAIGVTNIPRFDYEILSKEPVEEFIAFAVLGYLLKHYGNRNFSEVDFWLYWPEEIILEYEEPVFVDYVKAPVYSMTLRISGETFYTLTSLYTEAGYEKPDEERNFVVFGGNPTSRLEVLLSETIDILYERENFINGFTDYELEKLAMETIFLHIMSSIAAAIEMEAKATILKLEYRFNTAHFVIRPHIP